MTDPEATYSDAKALNSWSLRGPGKALPILQLVLLALGGLVFPIGNIANNWLWTDESTTVLTALGYPALGESPRELLDSLQMATYASADPGGFQVLLRLWIEAFGTSIEVVRALPFLFYAAYVAGLLGLARLVRLPWFLAFGVLGVALLDQFTKYYAFEVRPYAGALASATVLPCLARWLIDRPRLLPFLAFLGGLLLVATSSYTSIAVCVGTAAMLALASLSAQSHIARMWTLVGACLSLLVLPAVFLISGRLAEVRTSSVPGHTQDLLLAESDLVEIVSVLKTNFLALSALPKTLFLLAIPVWWIVSKVTHPRTKLKPTRMTPSVLLWLYVATATITQFVLSGVGVLPWVLGTRWSIIEFGLIAISILGLTSLLVTLIPSPRSGFKYVVAGVSLLLVAGGGFALARYERPSRPSFEEFVVTLAEQAPGRVVIDSWIYSDARYWLEFSGRFPSLRDTWINAQVRENWPPVAIGGTEIENFLADSTADILIVRSGKVLSESGVVLPSDITLVTIDPPSGSSLPTEPAPIALIKRD